MKLFGLTFHYHFQFFQTFEYYNYFDLAKIRISRARAAKTQFAFTLATFIRQNFKKKFLEPIQSYEDVLFLGPKCSICPKEKFYGTNDYYYFHLPIGTF